MSERELKWWQDPMELHKKQEIINKAKAPELRCVAQMLLNALRECNPDPIVVMGKAWADYQKWVRETKR